MNCLLSGRVALPACPRFRFSVFFRSYLLLSQKSIDPDPLPAAIAGSEAQAEISASNWLYKKC